MKRNALIVLGTLAFLAGPGARGGQVIKPNHPTPPPVVGNEYRSENLYTSPVPGAPGGIHFVSPVPLVEAVAVSQSDQEQAYRARKDQNGTDLSFSNLPIAKYDLVLVAKDRIFEGVLLNRGEDSLSSKDRSSIQEILSRSVPFFNTKRIEAIKGTPGDNGRAVALIQWMRIGEILNQADNLMVGHSIRTVRIATLADVGAGWQVINTREILRTDVFPDMFQGYLPVKHLDNLSGIRVIESVKDLGVLNLPAVTVAAGAPAAH